MTNIINEFIKEVEFIKEKSHITKSGWQVIYDPKFIVKRFSKALSKQKDRHIKKLEEIWKKDKFEKSGITLEDRILKLIEALKNEI